MKVQTADLKSAFDVCDAVPPTAMLKSSELIRVRQDVNKLRLTLTGELWAEAEITGAGAGKWTAYIDRRMLKAFLGRATAPEIEIFYKDKQVTFRSGGRLDLASADKQNGYESWAPQKLVEVPDETRKIIKVAASYLSADSGASHVAAVNFRKNYGVIATDTLVMLGFYGAPIANLMIPAVVAKALGDGGKLATGDKGVGAFFDHGYVYEPVSSSLDGYPLDMCKKNLEDARKAATIAEVEAGRLRDAAAAGRAFLLGTEVGLLKSVDGEMELAIPLLTGGAFTQKIPATVKSQTPVIKWAVKSATAWLEWAAAVQEDAGIEIAHITGALVLRFHHGSDESVYISSDL